MAASAHDIIVWTIEEGFEEAKHSIIVKVNEEIACKNGFNVNKGVFVN